MHTDTQTQGEGSDNSRNCSARVVWNGTLTPCPWSTVQLVAALQAVATQLHGWAPWHPVPGAPCNWLQPSRQWPLNCMAGSMPRSLHPSGWEKEQTEHALCRKSSGNSSAFLGQSFCLLPWSWAMCRCACSDECLACGLWLALDCVPDAPIRMGNCGCPWTMTNTLTDFNLG